GIIAPEQGLQILGELLPQSVNQVGVCPINWSHFWEQLPSGVNIPFLEAFASSKLQKETANSEEILVQLAAAVDSYRLQILIDFLQRKIAKLLGMSQSQLPNPELGFFSLGMDSLIAVELRNLLSSSLGCSINTTTLFKTSNIQDLAEYLIKEILPEEQSQKVDIKESQNITSPQMEIQEEGKLMMRSLMN
ncbi:MAG: hypothetical protein F6K34_27475, partial [Okeania sp. SIO4D6]|nr:hypothetical protein [Okeania sp. SIO4D6]